MFLVSSFSAGIDFTRQNLTSTVLASGVGPRTDRVNIMVSNEMEFHIKAAPGELPEDVEKNDMTLPSSHRFRNSSPGGLRPSTLPLGHGVSPQY